MRKHYPLNAAGAEDAGQLPWTDGVPSTGVEGSYPGHAIVTDTEAEILSATDAAGLVRSGADLTQLAQAISRGIYLGGFTGSANAIAAAIPNGVVLPSLLPGMRFRGIASITNTDAATFTLTGFATAPGTLSLLRRDGQALQAGDIPIGAPFDIQFDGSAIRFCAPAKSEIAVTIPGSALVHYGRDTSTTANTLTVPTVTPAITSLSDGMLFELVSNNTVTGASTISIAGLTGIPLLRRNATALVAGDVVGGVPFLALYLGGQVLTLGLVSSEVSATVTNVFNSKKIAGGVPTPFNTPGTSTLAIPAGTTFLAKYRGAGGGGGGANSTAAAGSGGGGGAYGEKIGTATTDVVLSITVGLHGSGGAGGGSPQNGTAGGTTSIVVQSGTVVDVNGTIYTAGQTFCAATGGGPGLGGLNGPQTSGAGSGGVSTGDTARPGQGGGFPRGQFTNGTYLGGSGGTSPLSGGAPGDNQGAAGNVGTSAGTGGNGSSANASGGDGTDGEASVYK